MKLFMLKIGARPQGRLIEQHDVMFVVANSLRETIPMVNQLWPEINNKWHLDAWREVQRVGNYKITLVENAQLTDGFDETSPKLYFVNLGGYLPNQFEEFHYKTLVIANTVGKATAQVKKSDFYRDYTFDNANPALSGIATSHVDDKHQLDVDDIHVVDALLPDGWGLKIEALDEHQQSTLQEDALHIGYISLKALKTLTV